MSQFYLPNDHEEARRLRESAAKEIETILFKCYVPSYVAAPIIAKVHEALAKKVIVGGLGELSAVNHSVQSVAE